MIKRVVAGSSGLSILGTAIYLLTNHISEVQYNNWGNGVWSNLLTIQGTGNCSDSSGTKDAEYYKACIQKDIKDAYDLRDMWNSDYWKTYYDNKLKNTTDKNKFQKLGSWEKFRELCTKAFDELIKNQDWNKLSNSIGPSQSQNITNDFGFDHCLKAKPVEKK